MQRVIGRPAPAAAQADRPGRSGGHGSREPYRQQIRASMDSIEKIDEKDILIA
jgi:hypothetical protein